MKLNDLVNYLESVVPPAYQESYDNSGIQYGEPDQEIGSVLLSVDITEEIVDEAVLKKCSMVISHHPLIFKPLKRISGRTAAEKILLKAIRNNIALYSMHTNLDLVKGGVSYRMAQKLDLENIEVLVPLDKILLKLVVFVPLEHAGIVRNAMFEAGAGHLGNYDRCSYNLKGEGTFRAGLDTNPYSGKKGKEHAEEEIRIETVIPEYLKNKVIRAMIESHPYEEVAYDLYRLENNVPGAGLGCVGEFRKSMSEQDLVQKLGNVFEARAVRHTEFRDRKIKKVAVMGGSGGNYTDKAISSGAEAFITADIKYHSFLDAARDILLIDIGHYESEKPSLEIINELITKKFPKFAVRFSEINTNPVNYSQVWQKRK